MNKYIISIIIILSLIVITNININTNKMTITKEQKLTIPQKEIEKPKGSISIESIKLYKDLYHISSANNNIEKNVTIKDFDEENNFFILMAHSGSGPIAFFKDLNKLDIKTKIKITYNNKEYYYYVTNIERQEKTGSIIIKKDRNTLVLTTCDNNNKQLIIYAKK